MQTVAGTDDYASLAETVSRRAAEYEKYALLAEHGQASDNYFGQKPDLLLMDGGRGQVSAAKAALAGTRLADVPLYGMVKDDHHRTRAIVDSEGREIAINMNRGTFTFVTAIQDETHRFANAYRKQQMKKKSYSSTLTEVPGVGPKTARALMAQFKSVGAVREATPEQLEFCVNKIQELNPKAAIITTDWAKLSGEQILKVMEGQDNLEMKALAEAHHAKEEAEHEHEHHHHDHDHEDHEHHHDHEDHEHHHDHEHEHDENCTCGCHDHEEHEHHHEHDENCTCGCHDHEHHHHHHADDVFTSWGKETPHKFERAKLEEVLRKFVDSDNILRSKGMVESTDGTWLYFDMVPGEYEIREGEPDYTGRIVVIGTEIHEDELLKIFGL